LRAEWHTARDLPTLQQLLSKGACDVVILCAGPGYGLEALRLVKTFAPDTPVVVLVPAEFEALALVEAAPTLTEFVSASRLPHGLQEALDKLLERKRRWELFESVPVGLYRSTPDGHILEANSTLCTMLGYSREELLGLNARALYLEVAEREQLIQQAAKSGLMLAQRIRLRRKDGQVLWVQAYSLPVRDSRGQVLYFEGSLIDISEQARLEERFRALVENTSDLI
jgi:PAS domain S-box-containing protein